MSFCTALLIVSLLAPVWSIEPVTYPASICSTQHCKMNMTSEELSDILAQINHDIPPAEFINSNTLLNRLLMDNENIMLLYLNSTGVVVITESEKEGTCPIHQVSPTSQTLLQVLQSTSNEIDSFSKQAIVHDVFSCSDVKSANEAAPSEYFYITTGNGSMVQVYCDMEGENCGGEGGWMRVAHVNMTQAGSQCPQGLSQQTIENGTYCGEFNVTSSCVSTVFSVLNTSYSQVCGQVRGYQYRCPDSFEDFWSNGKTSIEDGYVDGVSITHGHPRQHIWTYAVGIHPKLLDTFQWTCPCNSNNIGYSSPPFVGDDYYCESGTNDTLSCSSFYPNDPLWDGEMCDGFEGPCCTRPNMPWFAKTLEQPTSDAIELRVCADQAEDPGNEDVPLQLIELYVK